MVKLEGPLQVKRRRHRQPPQSKRVGAAAISPAAEKPGGDTIGRPVPGHPCRALGTGAVEAEGPGKVETLTPSLFLEHSPGEPQILQGRPPVHPPEIHMGVRVAGQGYQAGGLHHRQFTPVEIGPVLTGLAVFPVQSLPGQRPRPYIFEVRPRLPLPHLRGDDENGGWNFEVDQHGEGVTPVIKVTVIKGYRHRIVGQIITAGHIVIQLIEGHRAVAGLAQEPQLVVEEPRADIETAGVVALRLGHVVVAENRHPGCAEVVPEPEDHPTDAADREGCEKRDHSLLLSEDDALLIRVDSSVAGCAVQDEAGTDHPEPSRATDQKLGTVP